MSELKVERKENMCGGEGHILIKHILGEKELNGKCGLYACLLYTSPSPRDA